MLNIKYTGLRIEPTLSATNELLKEKLDLYDVVEVLNKGYDCARSKRKKNIIERCTDRKNKTIKVVVIRTISRYPDGFQEEVWRLIHVGRFTRR